jgi:hypothetical protein
MRGKLTKRSVEALKSDVRDTFLWDTEIPGFGCKITPKDKRIYLLQYGRRGRDHRVTIGRHGIDVTAEQGPAGSSSPAWHRCDRRDPRYKPDARSVCGDCR